MFTGLVEEIGHVASLVQRPDAMRLEIRAVHVLADARIGDSIAVNGVCVTITTLRGNRFAADVMPETLRATALNRLKNNDAVNLERALRADSRYGGHFVTGHSDGVGRIAGVAMKGNARELSIKADGALLANMAVKGSVAVDGTSLTVFAVGAHTFAVSLIPHSSQHSVLGDKKIGDSVNIECDLLQKYARGQTADQMAEKKKEPLSLAMLRAHGFA